jgi:hypothetical protein
LFGNNFVTATATDPENNTSEFSAAIEVTPGNVGFDDPVVATGPDAGLAPLVQVYDAVTGAHRFAFYAYPESFLGGVRVAVGDVTGDGVPDIITAPGPGMAAEVKVFDGAAGELLYSFDAYPEFEGGAFVAVGDVTGDGLPEIITGPDAGGVPDVGVFYGSDGAPFFNFLAFDESFSGGVRVDAGDVNNDQIEDIFVAAGPGGEPHVRVFDGASQGQSLIHDFLAYDAGFTGGVYVAAGDVNGDGFSDIVTGAGAGGEPDVRVFSGEDLFPLQQFFAFDLTFTGGVRVAAGDVNDDGKADIVAGAGPGDAPLVRVFDGDTQDILNEYFAYEDTFTGGVFVAVTDSGRGLEANSQVFAVGADAGRAPLIRVFDARTRRQRFAFYAFPVEFRGGVRVAVGDVNGDRIPDIIAAAGPGGGGIVKVFSGANGRLLHTFSAGDAGFTGGINVAVGDVNGDGKADVIAGQDAGGSPRVRVFSGANGGVLYNFTAYDTAYRGGVRVAAGDVNGDGKADIITAPGAGIAAIVKVFSGANGSLLSSFQALGAGFSGGAFIAAGDVDGDGRADIVTGSGSGSAPRVNVYSGATGGLLRSFLAYDAAFTGGVRVAARDVNGDGRSDIVVGAGLGDAREVRVFDGLSTALIDRFFAYESAFRGGFFVG